MGFKQLIYKIRYHKYDRYYFDDEKTSLVSGYRDLYLRGKHFDDMLCQDIWVDEQVCNIIGAGRKHKPYVLPIMKAIAKCDKIKGTKVFEEQYASLMEMLKNLVLRNGKRIIWQRILYILFTRGFFRAACVLRKKYEEYLLQYGGTAEKFSVLVETGRFKEAEGIMNKSFCIRVMKYLGLREYETYSDCIGAFLSETDRIEQKNDSLFREKLRGRKLFIIGPSDNGEMVYMKEEDRMIQYAYFGKKAEKYKGHRLNFAYYNGKYGDKLIETDYEDIIYDLDMCIFKYEDDRSVRKMLYQNEKGRRARWSHRIMFFGSPNMLQLTLTDLLAMGAEDIVVLDNNLYLNNVYNKDYVSTQVIAQMDGYTRMMQFAQHDIIGNFQYLKSLYKKGLFSCDKILDEIMSMSLMEYAYAMEKENGCLR